MPYLFNVTYEIITPESAEHGYADESGFVLESAPLREAIDAVHGTRTSRVDGVECIECDSWPAYAPERVLVINGREYETGAQESRSLHIPLSVTPSSARRIARVIGYAGP